MLYRIPQGYLGVGIAIGVLLLIIALLAKRIEQIKIERFGVTITFKRLGGLSGSSRLLIFILGLVLVAGELFLILGPLPPTAPEGVVRLYYERVNKADYQPAWEMLTGNFKCRFFPPCDGEVYNFEAFENNWDKYTSINVRNAHVLAQDDEGAQLETDLEFMWTNGDVTTARDIVFHLTPERGGIILKQNWLIDKTTSG